MRIMIVTDAWLPQINGVVRTLATLVEELRKEGHEIILVSPDQFHTMPCPTYPEIRLALLPGQRMGRLIEDSRPSAIHIATEGPLGWAARNYCVRHALPFTTAYHTRFPEYVCARFRIPPSVSYEVVRHFHNSSQATMVATQTIANDLKKRGFNRIQHWGRGVDTKLFHPGLGPVYDLPRPIFLYVGRLAVEKNVESFLALDLPGSKVAVGDGPLADKLKRRFPDVLFLGVKQGEELAAHYADADVFVFPSRTDTFGLVLLEAMACGLPVAAYPVAGPLDVLGVAPVGCLDMDLAKAARNALALSREQCRHFAETFSWSASTRQFLTNLALIKWTQYRHVGVAHPDLILFQHALSEGTMPW